MAVLGLCSGNPAYAAAGSIGTTTTQSNPGVELERLRLQIVALEQRIQILERPKVEKPEDLGADELRTQELNRRFAAIEQKLAERKTSATDSPPKPDEASITVRAPFVVHDDQGRTIFRVDITPEGDQPRVVVGNALGAHVQIGPTLGGQGAGIGLYNDPGDLGGLIAASPTGSQLVLKDKNLTAFLGTQPDGGKQGLFLRKDTQVVVSASVEGTGGMLTVAGPRGANGPRAELGPRPEGDGAELLLYAAQPDVVAEISTSSSGSVLALEDNALSVILGSDNAERRGLFLYRGDADYVAATIDPNLGGAIQVGTATGDVAAFLESGEAGGTIGVTNGAEARSVVEIKAVESAGALEVFGPLSDSKPLVNLRGMAAGGVVEVAGATYKVGVSMVADEGGGELAVLDGAAKTVGTMSAETGGNLELIGPAADGNPQLSLRATTEGGRLDVSGPTGKKAVQLSGDARGGVLKTNNPQGRAVGGILATETGGRVIVTGAQGGDTIGALHAGEGGGHMTLWDTKKKARVVAIAGESGQINVSSASGAVTLDATDGASPLLQITDGTGNPVVHAGISKGVGVVNTGPNGSGPAGVIGGGLKPASSLRGTL